MTINIIFIFRYFEDLVDAEGECEHPYLSFIFYPFSLNPPHFTSKTTSKRWLGDAQSAIGPWSSVPPITLTCEVNYFRHASIIFFNYHEHKFWNDSIIGKVDSSGSPTLGTLFLLNRPPKWYFGKRHHRKVRRLVR